MATTYSPLARIAIMQQLDPSVRDVWGNIADQWPVLLEQLAAGRSVVALTGVNVTLTTANNAPDQSRADLLQFTGIGNCTVRIPGLVRQGWALSQTTGIVTLTTGTGITLPLTPGVMYRYRCNGTDVVVDPLFVGAVVGTTATFSGGLTGTTGTFSNTVTTPLLVVETGAGPAVLIANGNVTVPGILTAHQIINTSDYRLKTTFGPADVGAIIDAMPVWDAEWKDRPGERRPMLLAHEVAEAGAAFAVHGERDAVDVTGDIVAQGIDWPTLIPVLLAEVKALRARVATLEAR